MVTVARELKADEMVLHKDKKNQIKTEIKCVCSFFRQSSIITYTPVLFHYKI